jgi:hypothetical protein
MKFTSAIVLTLALLLNSNAFGQDYYAGPKKEERMRIAVGHINALDSGVLLVRLNTYSRKVAALKNNGYEAKANHLVAEQQKKHKKIVAAFQGQYKFSDVYYFYAENSGKVKSGEFEGVVLDASLANVDLPLNGRQVYVLDSERASLTDMSTDQIGFMIITSQLESLDDPFPAVVRKRVGTKIAERTYDEMVMTLQSELVVYRKQAKIDQATLNHRDAKRELREERKAVKVVGNGG